MSKTAHLVQVEKYLCESFKKEGELYTVDNIQYNSCFIVLRPDEIPNIDYPGFGGTRRKTQAEYLDYVQKGQVYFDEYERTGHIAALKALKRKSLVGLSEHDEWLLAFEHNFLGPDCASVEIEKGEYVLSSNGSHRMYVAKKYGLKLLVKLRKHVVL